MQNQDETGEMLLNELECTHQISGLIHPILHNRATEKFVIWAPKPGLQTSKKSQPLLTVKAT